MLLEAGRAASAWLLIIRLPEVLIRALATAVASIISVVVSPPVLTFVPLTLILEVTIVIRMRLVVVVASIVIVTCVVVLVAEAIAHVQATVDVQYSFNVADGGLTAEVPSVDVSDLPFFD